MPFHPPVWAYGFAKLRSSSHWNLICPTKPCSLCVAESSLMRCRERPGAELCFKSTALDLRTYCIPVISTSSVPIHINPQEGKVLLSVRLEKSKGDAQQAWRPLFSLCPHKKSPLNRNFLNKSNLRIIERSTSVQNILTSLPCNTKTMTKHKHPAGNIQRAKTKLRLLTSKRGGVKSEPLTFKETE